MLSQPFELFFLLSPSHVEVLLLAGLVAADLLPADEQLMQRQELHHRVAQQHQRRHQPLEHVPERIKETERERERVETCTSKESKPEVVAPHWVLRSHRISMGRVTNSTKRKVLSKHQKGLPGRAKSGLILLLTLSTNYRNT